NFGQMVEYPVAVIRSGDDPILINDPLFGLWRSYNEAERDVWENEAFYEQGHLLEASLDLDDRKAAFNAMMDIFDADPPAIILHTKGVFYGKKRSLRWDPFPSVYMFFHAASDR